MAKDYPELEFIALKLLRGVGSASDGEWRRQNSPDDQGMRVFHVLRRLTPAEAAVTGPAVDLRGTPDQARRAERIARLVGTSPDVLIRLG